MRVLLLFVLIVATLATPTAIEPAIHYTSQKPSRGERVLTCEATAYTHSMNMTRTNTWPKEGRTIAVDPSVIPLGSEVCVSCPTWPQINGVYVAEDTGSKIQGCAIDVFMDSKTTCLEFGRRQVEVRILD